MNNLIRHNNHLKQSRILLKQFFCATSQQSMTQPRKRTVINHIAGQIVTEEDVIKQLEQKKKTVKKTTSRTTGQQSSSRKRRKADEN